MKKQNALASKLAFNKEKIANLSPADLDQLHGGEVEGGHGGSSQSTHNNFTCCICTNSGHGGGGIADEQGN